MAPDALTSICGLDQGIIGEAVDSKETIQIILEYAGLLIHAGHKWGPRSAQLTIQVLEVTHYLIDHCHSMVVIGARSLPEVREGRILRHLAKFGDKIFGSRAS